MKGLEWQVSSLEPSKRLKELGVKQDGMFSWNPPIGVDMGGKDNWNLCFHAGVILKNYPAQGRISAFTVAELGEILPDSVISQKEYPDVEKEGKPRWFALDEKIGMYQTSDTEADARANILIYLIQNNLVKP